MAVKPIPDGYHSVTPYLVVKGADRLIDFVKQAFGAVEKHRHALPDGSVQHAEVQIGDSPVMLGEARGDNQPKPGMLYLYVEDVDAVYRRAIQAGAKSLREPTDEFYGDRSSGVSDESGTQWWIATHKEDVSPEELERRQAAHAKH